MLAKKWRLTAVATPRNEPYSVRISATVGSGAAAEVFTAAVPVHVAPEDLPTTIEVTEPVRLEVRTHHMLKCHQARRQTLHTP